MMKNYEAFYKMFKMSPNDFRNMNDDRFERWWNEESKMPDKTFGEWIPSDFYPGLYVCSACRDAYVDREWVLEPDNKWHFCPNCGAIMKRKKQL